VQSRGFGAHLRGRGALYGAAMDEEREPHEERLAAEIERLMREKLEADYRPAETRRDAHPRHLGLLSGTFTVSSDLPLELRVGLFAQPRSYEAWVRSSSASGKPQSDAVRDLRGLAIKLRGVDGEKIPESDEPHTQDFVLLSVPAMPLGTVKLFRDAIYFGIKRSLKWFAAKMLLTGQLRVLRGLEAARQHQTSPLEIRYWSTTPYRFGDRIVKYSLIPTSGTPTALPAVLTEHYLTEAMERRLATETVTFDFAVQLQQPGMPINDSAPRWDEAASPFRTVATLTIPPQTFRGEERDRLAEALSFSPAHARVEHRPTGSINRARMRIYRAMSAFRHQRRGLPRLDDL
jgi:hypothetical protein